MKEISLHETELVGKSGTVFHLIQPPDLSNIWKREFSQYHYIATNPVVVFGVLCVTETRDPVGIILFSYYMPVSQRTVHVSRWVVGPAYREEKLGTRLLVSACRSVYSTTGHRILIRLQNFELADALLRGVFFTKLPKNKLFSASSGGLTQREMIDKPAISLVFSESESANLIKPESQSEEAGILAPSLGPPSSPSALKPASNASGGLVDIDQLRESMKAGAQGVDDALAIFLKTKES